MQSLVKLNFPGVFVSGVLIYSIIQKPLGLVYISPWLLVLAALLAGAGLSLIISPRKFRRKFIYQNGQGHWENDHVEDNRWETDEPGKRAGYSAVYHAEFGEADGAGPGAAPSADDAEPQVRYNGTESAQFGSVELEVEAGDDNHPYAKVSFGDSSRYIHGQAVETALFEVNIGHMSVYFDGAKPAPGGLEIAVDVNLGALEFYFPRDWNVRESVSTSLGGVENDQRNSTRNPDGPPVLITGSVSLGGIEIHYV
ncbi:hypothetical protein LJC60_08315 [Ruminococcaceae bacterium OttesenSCG-928-D13]|nr:hypothetical protein [Ruminococcaceae bacterium OttesenSCG-928-D13]